MTNAAPTADDEVSFISGVSDNGTVAAHSYRTWNGGHPIAYPITYNKVGPVDKWGSSRTAGTSGGTETYWFDGSSHWTATEQLGFKEGLAIWSAEANISFTPASSAATADLVFYRGGSSNGAYEVSPNAQQVDVGSASLGTVGSGAEITFQTSPDYYGEPGSFTDSGGYGMQTVVHEEGHFLGLGHAGPYDGSVDPGSDQFSTYDNSDYSLMSYIDAEDKSAKFYSRYTVKGTSLHGNFATTPMMLDILAAQRLYGAPTKTPLSGGQVFGFNTNITGLIQPFFDFTKNVNPVVTLFDTGTGNTLDLSGYHTPETVNLDPGTFSSFDGMVNNVAIAVGTHIDTAIGGSGNNIFTVNGDSDTINGGTGGHNTVVFSGNKSAYTVAGRGTAIVRVSRGGTIDTLTNVQTLQFADGSVSTLCFAAGTRVATPHGPRAVDSLRPGDDVIATDAAGARRTAPVRWVGRRAVDLAGHPDPSAAAPVRIRAGAIAPGVPAADVVLSPDHCVFLGGHLVRARRLINGSGVVQERPSHVVYVHVELHAHALLIAEGLLAESYREEGHRHFFEPVSRDTPPALIGPACAPFADDRVAETVWRSVARRADFTPSAPAQAA